MLLEKASRNRDFVFVGESDPNFKALRGGRDRGSLAAVNVGSRRHGSFPCVDGFRWRHFFAAPHTAMPRAVCFFD